MLSKKWRFNDLALGLSVIIIECVTILEWIYSKQKVLGFKESIVHIIYRIFIQRF